MKTWMFGASTPFSKEIIKNLHNPIVFGRHNVDYTMPQKFIKEHIPQYVSSIISPEDSPLNIVINVNLGEHTARASRELTTLPTFKSVFLTISPNIFFFYSLLSEMNRLKLPVKVCYVTSTYGNTSMKNKKEHLPAEDKIDYPIDFKYSSARLVQQSAMMSQVSDTCQVLGVNPSQLDVDDNISKYAKEIAELIYKSPADNQWNKIYCLKSGGWYGYFGDGKYTIE
jgi:hypothetical protein